MVYKLVRGWAETLRISLYTRGVFLKKAYGNRARSLVFICWNAPAWLACSRRSDSRVREKNSRRKKNEGRLEGERGREPHPPPPPILPVYNLTHSPLTATLYCLSAWNRLLPDTTSLKAFGQILLLTFLVYEVPRGVLLRIRGGGVLPGSPNLDPISNQKLSFFTPVFRPGP